jgi:threonine/homoserine/homoserine lactone efflux protein
LGAAGTTLPVVSFTQLAVFLPAAALVALPPGANNLLAMQHGMRFGVTEAVIALTGRITAFAVMLGLAAAGLAAVLTRSQTMFELLKGAGVAYLAYLGIRRLVAPPVTADSLIAAGRMVRAPREFLTVAANPKALLLFTAFLPQFVDPAEPAAGQLLVLGALYIAIELVAATGWAFAGHRLRLADLCDRARRRLNQAFGGPWLSGPPRHHQALRNLSPHVHPAPVGAAGRASRQWILALTGACPSKRSVVGGVAVVQHEVVAVRVGEEGHVTDPRIHDLTGEHDALGLELGTRGRDVVNVKREMGILLWCERHAESLGLPNAEASVPEPDLEARTLIRPQPERVDVEVQGALRILRRDGDEVQFGDHGAEPNLSHTATTWAAQWILRNGRRGPFAGLHRAGSDTLARRPRCRP